MASDIQSCVDMRVIISYTMSVYISLDLFLQESHLYTYIKLYALQANDGQFIKDDNITTKHSVVKRSTTTTTTSPNEKTLEILRGRDGRDGKDGSQGPRGRDGRDGLPGPKGMTGPPGQKGDTGVPGPKGDVAGGVVYVRWGHNSCPKSGAQLVYPGRAGGSYYDHKGGGGNPQCLPLNPTFYKTVSGTQNLAFMYGAEYEATNSLVSNSHDSYRCSMRCMLRPHQKCSLYDTS